MDENQKSNYTYEIIDEKTLKMSNNESKIALIIKLKDTPEDQDPLGLKTYCELQRKVAEFYKEIDIESIVKDIKAKNGRKYEDE
jgi:predicted RND superfamily exporter protein